MKVEAYDAVGNEILREDIVQKDDSSFKVIEILPKNMIRCTKEEKDDYFYIFVGEGVTKQ